MDFFTSSANFSQSLLAVVDADLQVKGPRTHIPLRASLYCSSRFAKLLRRPRVQARESSHVEASPVQTPGARHFFEHLWGRSVSDAPRLASSLSQCL